MGCDWEQIPGTGWDEPAEYRCRESRCDDINPVCKLAVEPHCAKHFCDCKPPAQEPYEMEYPVDEVTPVSEYPRISDEYLKLYLRELSMDENLNDAWLDLRDARAIIAEQQRINARLLEGVSEQQAVIARLSAPITYEEWGRCKIMPSPSFMYIEQADAVIKERLNG